MKILKILLILLVPALGIVGCQKSDTRPCSNHSAEKTESTDNTAVSSKFTLSEQAEEVGSTPVVGSGDDDRDGGDKKPKKLR